MIFRLARRVGICLFALSTVVGVSNAYGARQVRPPAAGGLRGAPPHTHVAWQGSVEADLKTAAGKVTVSSVPLEDGRRIDLELEPFNVVSAATRFVIGAGATARSLDFDPSSVRLFRGSVSGLPNSRVYLALGEHTAAGHIEFGGQHFDVSRRPAGNGLVVFSPSMSFQTIPAEWCGLEHFVDPEASGGLAQASDLGPHHEQGHPDQGPGDHQTHHGPPVQGSAVLLNQNARRRITAANGLPDPVKGMQLIELAVDSDHEYFELFGDEAAATEYIVMLYGAVSEIYMHDVNTRIELSFVRLFDSDDDEPPFMNTTPDPLSPFRNFWNAEMDEVNRDAAQFLSGRRNLPYGGEAYLSALCASTGYSVVGYVLGFFPGPDFPMNGHYDLTVTAHELGHNCGTAHTHDYGLDNCNLLGSNPQRGTIMSYCSQTVSGSEANIDGRFHAYIQGVMKEYINSVECVADDCNFNSIDDTTDVLFGGSLDFNDNGIPDECEDCNNNSVLDDADIGSGTSQDVNGNDLPDECEPDCNGNDIPDDWEVAQGLAPDLYGHNYPDECDADCNNNGLSDYNELQAEMSLDINRNIILDECELCSASGATDLEVLGGAHDVWAASQTMDRAAEFHANSGVRVRFSTAGFIEEGTDVVISAAGRILVASGLGSRVVEFDGDGAYVGDFVSAGSGGLDYAAGLAFKPDGNLLVASRDNNRVLEYDGDSGAFVDGFVGNGSGGLAAPYGLTFGPDGHLYVSSSGTDEVLKYDGSTGAPLGAFVESGSGGLLNPRGLTFKPDGNLLVASHDTNKLLEYDRVSGAFVGKFNNGGTETNLTLAGPWSVHIGPNGNVFASRIYENGMPPGGGLDAGNSLRFAALHITSTRIYEFDIRNGNFLKSYVTGNDTDFVRVTGFDFMPGWDADCNVNYHPDECDIAAGTSTDVDDNGVPDECEVDCNSNGVLDRLDIIPYGHSFDCNFNLAPDECEIASGSSSDCDGNGLLDECDLAAGAVLDDDQDGVPDICQCGTPTITDQPQDEVLPQGGEAVFEIVADGSALGYQWQKDGHPLTDSAGVNGSQTAMLTLSEVELEDAGTYRCVVSDGNGCVAVSDGAVLVVLAGCVADLTEDGTVGAADLAQVLGNWGPNPGHPADFNGDGAVGPADLAIVLGYWGPCPG